MTEPEKHIRSACTALRPDGRTAKAGTASDADAGITALRIRIEDLDKFAAVAELVREDLIAQLTAAEAEVPRES